VGISPFITAMLRGVCPLFGIEDEVTGRKHEEERIEKLYIQI